MINVGSQIIVVSIAPEWNIPDEYLNQIGVVSEVARDRYSITFQDGLRLVFPKNTVREYTPNRFNPSGYVSDMIALPLP